MKQLVTVILLFMLTACATKINHPSAPQEQINNAKSFNVHPEKVRVHFFMGKYNGDGFQLNEAMEIYVNEIKVVSLGNKNEYAFIDLSPGNYSYGVVG